MTGSLAAEMYDSFIRKTEQKGIRCRVKISTRDHKDPFYPGDTDILVATFETFSPLLSSPDRGVGRVVVDEIHLLADESRGPALEGLLVRLKTWREPKSLCALSAVVSNPEELAGWLGVRSSSDQPKTAPSGSSDERWKKTYRASLPARSNRFSGLGSRRSSSADLKPPVRKY
ncbi:MAG TPA: hypothetical protein GX507_00275 [Clostridia bacterium]|nr:hypothetical protein [Clostridia bacterium]